MPSRQRDSRCFSADARIFVFTQRFQPLPGIFGVAFTFGQFCSGPGEVRVAGVVHQCLIEGGSSVVKAALVQLGRAQSGFGQGLFWHAVFPGRARALGGSEITSPHGHHGLGLQDFSGVGLPLTELLKFEGGFAESSTLHETKSGQNIGGSHAESVRETKKRDAEASRKILGCSEDQPPKV
jgi:hypothetical protein